MNPITPLHYYMNIYQIISTRFQSPLFPVRSDIVAPAFKESEI